MSKVLIVVLVAIAVAPATSSRTSALKWLSWRDIRAIMARGSMEFRRQGEFVRPGRYPGNIYGGRFICKAALGDQDGTGKGRHLRHSDRIRPRLREFAGFSQK